MIEIKCAILIGEDYLTPKLELTKNIDEALIITGKRKAKKAIRQINSLTNGLLKPRIKVV